MTTRQADPRETPATGGGWTAENVAEVACFALEVLLILSGGVIGAWAAWLIMGSPDAF